MSKCALPKSQPRGNARGGGRTLHGESQAHLLVRQGFAGVAFALHAFADEDCDFEQQV